MIFRFFVIIVTSIAFLIGIKILSNMWKAGTFISVNSQDARESIVVIIDRNQREMFFEQLERFAIGHNFKIHIGATTPTEQNYNIYLSRKDIDLFGSNALYPSRYEIAIYDNDPADPATEEFINNLLNDLKKFLGEIPNIRIFE